MVTFIHGVPVNVPDLGDLWFANAALLAQEAHVRRSRELHGEIDTLGRQIDAAIARSAQS